MRKLGGNMEIFVKFAFESRNMWLKKLWVEATSRLGYKKYLNDYGIWKE